MKRFLLGFILCGALVAPSAFAQEEGVSYGRGQGWSVLAADTLGDNNTAFSAQLGWPGLTLGVLHGGTSKFDIGGKFTFNYGQEGLVEIVEPGIKFQAWVRLMLVRTPQASLALVFQPGPLFYFQDGSTEVGLALPVSLVAGIPVGSALMLNVGLDIPFYVIFGTGGGVVVPVLLGAGMEYFLDRNLAVNFNVRMGPSVGSYSDYGIRGRARFTLEALLGIAYKF